MTPGVHIVRASDLQELAAHLPPVLDLFRDLLPADRSALVLLKPNLNSNMNALTGNTTDLRLLATVIRWLKDNGCTNIALGEGTNSGFYRSRISVIDRLGVRALAEHFGVRALDLNYSDPAEVPFENGTRAGVARECLDAALFINLPKMKTHFEAGMSVCLKNMMGCLVGQANKKKTHESLAANILNLNQSLRPHLHIVDAMIAMEGLGPTRGTPVRLDRVFVGRDPYVLDMVCARAAQFPREEVRTLALARQRGLLTPERIAQEEAVDVSSFARPFAKPVAGWFATFIHSPKRQKYFLKIRQTPFFTYLASTKWFGHLLFKTGLRQDVFLDQELACTALHRTDTPGTGPESCAGLCPLGNKRPGEDNEGHACIRCLYCLCTEPEGAIQFEGDLGFFREQLRQYDTLIRAMYAQTTTSASTQRKASTP